MADSEEYDEDEHDSRDEDAGSFYSDERSYNSGRGDDQGSPHSSYNSGSFDSREGDDRRDHQRQSVRSFGGESDHSDDRSYSRSGDDRSFHDDDRSYRSGEDSYRNGDSYRSGESYDRDGNSRGDSFRDGDGRLGDSYREGDSRSGDSYREGDSRGSDSRGSASRGSGSYREGDSADDSYRKGDDRPDGSFRGDDSRSGSYREGDSRSGSYTDDNSRGSYRDGDSRSGSNLNESYRDGDSRSGSYREGDSRGEPYSDEDSKGGSFRDEDSRRSRSPERGDFVEGEGSQSFRGDDDSLHSGDVSRSQSPDKSEESFSSFAAENVNNNEPAAFVDNDDRSSSFEETDNQSRKTDNSRPTESVYDSEAPSFAEDVDFSPTRSPMKRQADGINVFDQPSVPFENGGFGDDAFGNFPSSDGNAGDDFGKFDTFDIQGKDETAGFAADFGGFGEPSQEVMDGFNVSGGETSAKSFVDAAHSDSRSQELSVGSRGQSTHSSSQSDPHSQQRDSHLEEGPDGTMSQSQSSSGRSRSRSPERSSRSRSQSTHSARDSISGSQQSPGQPRSHRSSTGSRSRSSHASMDSRSRSGHSQSRSPYSSQRSQSRSPQSSIHSGSQSIQSHGDQRTESPHSSAHSGLRSAHNSGSIRSASVSLRSIRGKQPAEENKGDEFEQSMMLGDVFGQPQELFSDFKAKQEENAIQEHSESERSGSEPGSHQSSLRSDYAPPTQATAAKTPTAHSEAISLDTDIVSPPERLDDDEESGFDDGQQGSPGHHQSDHGIPASPHGEPSKSRSMKSGDTSILSRNSRDVGRDDGSLSASEGDHDGSKVSAKFAESGSEVTGLFGDQITLDSKGTGKMSNPKQKNGAVDKMEPLPSPMVNIPGNRVERGDADSLDLTVSTFAESHMQAQLKEEKEGQDNREVAESGQRQKRKKKRKKRRKKSARSEALLEFVANVNDAMLELENGEQRSDWVESKENNLDSSAHRLLHGYEALLGILLQLSDELELISTFAKAKRKKDINLTVHVQALKAVLSFAQTLDQLFTQLKPILQSCFEEEPDEEMDDMLYRLNSLVDLLSETTHRVGEKQEWNERAETIYVTLLELMERETLELTCYFDDVDTPEYELSANIHEAWSATGHIEELRALQYASDPWLFRQLCYEVMVSIDYPWCPDTSMLMEICGIDASMLEEEPDPEYLEDDELAPIPQAAEHVLDKINGDPLPRPATLASILRRILPPRAVTDPTLLDNFISIRNTIQNPLGLSATNIVSISSIPEVLNDPDALGVGGVGKTTLAAMVASHPDVRKYFIDGVVWVYVGDKELNYSRYTQCLRELVAQLDFYQGVPLFAELLHTPGETLSKRRRREEGFMIYARDTIAELLHDRSVLIILDDVCFEPDLDWFDFAPMPGESTDDVDSTCALLVTTRCRTLLPAADTVEIDMCDEADAISLLIQESGQLSHSLMAESREARSVVRECANHPLAVKSVGRWLNLKHATAGVVSSVEEIHADVIKSMDKILKGGDHNGTDMMYEILSMSLSPAINGEPTNIIKFCLAAFVVTFCDREYISDFALTEPTPIIPMDMAELLFETLLEMNESSLLKEGSLFYSQKKEAAVLIPEALSALGVLKVITYSDSEEPENPEDEQKFLQIMHFIHQEYGEYLCKEDESLEDLTKDAERIWNRALVEAYLSQVGEWDVDLEDARHSYALEMIISHMIRGGMYGAASELLADRGFVRGRLLSLGRENATRRHVKDCEALFQKLRERRSKGNAKLEPRTVMKQAYQALGGQLAMDDDDQSLEDVRIRDVEVARAHYEIGFSLAEKRCWDASIAHWETSQELLVSALGTVEVVAGILYNIGVVYSEMNEYEQALDSLKQCLRIRGTIHGEEHILYAQTIQKIGDVFLGMSDYHEAMESYNWALDVMYTEPAHHRVDIGEILDNKGSIHYSKGEIEEALQCHQDALRSKQVDLGEDHPELAVTFQHIGNCLSDQGNIEDAIVHFEEAIRLKELDPEGGPERDADVLTIEGVLHNLEGSQEQGLECYEKSLQILVTKVPHRKEKVASLLHLIGCVYLMSGEHKKAMKLFEESLQARRKVLGFVHLDVASTLFNMAFLHQTRNRLDKALKCLEEALKIRQLRLPDSEKVAVTHEKIGTLARAIGKTKKAEIAFEEALRIRKLIHGEQHEAVATVLQELGDLNDDLGEYDYAMNYYIDALDIRRNKLGPDDVAVAETLYSMGFTLHNNDASDRALVCFEESLSIRRFQLGEDSKEVGDTLNMMGFLKAKRGELDDALTLLWDALRIRKLQEDHVKVSETLKNIGNVHREKQEQELAVECYEECLRIRRAELGPEHEKVADALIAMGNVQSDMERTDEAMRSYQEALKIRTMVYGEHDESVAAVLQYMGTMEFRTGNHEKARDLLTEFIRIRRDNNTKNDGDYVNVLFMIGNIHKMQGNEDEAQVCWSEAYEVFQELGLAETNPQIAKVMNHLLKVEANTEELEDQKKKSRAGVFGKVTEKLKDTLRDEKLSLGGKKRRKGKGIQL